MTDLITSKLVFGYKTSDTLPSPLPSEVTIDFAKIGTKPQGDLTWNRMLNKNIIYTKLPTEDETDGGFGYDLGFLEDTWTFTWKTFDYDEFERVNNLCRTITATETTVHAVLLFHNLTYNVIIRTVQSNGTPGGDQVRITITCTVVGEI